MSEEFMEGSNYDLKGLSQLCASFDEGGGVALGDAFAIYSIVASSPDWNATTFNELHAELISAASAVEKVIPVLYTRENAFTVDIVSLPCPKHPPFNSTNISPRDSLPWFLVNASKFSKHQIVGRGDIIESLLIILQRPWCVLELCCCDTLAISAIHRFAIIATKIKPELYNHASILLHQELSRRTILSLSDLKHSGIFRAEFDTSFAIKDVYIDLSFSRLRSHNSFWLRLICTCAPYLGISCSDLVRILSDMTSKGVNPSRQKHANHEYDSSIERLSFHSQSSVTTSTRKSVLLTRSISSLKDHGKCLAQYDLKILSSNLEFLLLIYRQVLQIVSESLP